MARYRKSGSEIIYTDKFKGLDMSREEKKTFSSSVYMKNFTVTEQYDLKKRPGYKKLTDGIVCDSCFYAETSNGGYFVYKNRKTLCAIRMTDCARLECETDSTASVGYFVFGGAVYIYGRGFYYKFDGRSFTKLDTYVPTIAVTCSPSGAGTVFESLNLLSDKAKISFSPDGTSTAYVLPKNAKSVVSVMLDGVELDDGYTYNAQSHTLTFDRAPAGGVPDSLTVTFYLSDETVMQMSYIGSKFCIYGGARDSRVFAYGSKNVLYYSDVTGKGSDVTYFPADNFITVGDGGTVTALVRHYDRLIIFKEKETWFLSPSSVDCDGYSKPSFPLSPLNSTVGCAGGGAVYADNTPVTLSYDGIYVFGQSIVRDERNAKRISDRAAPYLTPALLYHGVVYDFETKKEIWICSGEDVLIYNYGNDTFYAYDDIPAELFFSLDGEAAFYSDGAIYVFDEGTDTDDGKAFTATFESGFVCLDRTAKKRRLKRICLSYMPVRKGVITVSAEANRGGGCTAIFSGGVPSGFDFASLDFTAFTFNCSDTQAHLERRAHLSSFEALKLKITGEGGRSSVSSVSLYVDGA
jgi:hypothetical protein